MFRVAVQEPGKEALFSVHTVSVNSLYEAERIAVELAQKQYPDMSVMLVHRGGLVYDIYEIAEPIGQVQIQGL